MADDVDAMQIQRRTASVLTNMVVGAICVSLSLASYICFYRWFMVASGWDGLNALQKRVSRQFYSESALYFTFTDQVANEDIDIGDAFWLNVNDTRTEYPTIMNPLHRFNVWPETIVALIWRGLPPVFRDSDVANFYVRCAMISNGVGVSGLFLLAWRLGDRGITAMLCGLNALVMWGSHWFQGYLYANRLISSPALRENWALPFLFFQIAALCSQLRQSGRPPHGPTSRTSICVWTTLSVLSWQFTQFLLWLELLALLCVHVVGWGGGLARIRDTTRSILLGILIATVAMWGNTMLIASFSVSLCLAVEVVTAVIARASGDDSVGDDSGGNAVGGGDGGDDDNGGVRCGCSGKRIRRAIKTVAARVVTVLCCLALMAVLKSGIAFAFGIGDDEHVGAIFVAKAKDLWRGRKLSDGLSFSVLQYLCQGTYDVMSLSLMSAYWQHPAKLPQHFGVALMLVTVYVVWGSCRECVGESNGGVETKEKDTGDKAVSSADGQMDGQAPGVSQTKNKDITDQLREESSSSPANRMAPSLPEAQQEARVDLVFMLFFCVALLLLAVYVQRLAVVAVPVISAFASGVLYSYGHAAQVVTWALKHIAPSRCGRPAIGRFGVLCGLVWFGVVSSFAWRQASDPLLTLLEDLAREPNRYYQDVHETSRLVNFMNANTPSDAVVVGDGPISSTLRLLMQGQRSIVTHPHNENVAVRRKQELMYQMYNRVSEKELSALYRRQGIDYVVITRGPCRLQCRPRDDIPVLTMADIANATSSSLRVARGLPSGQLHREPFCLRVHGGRQPRRTRYFEMVYLQDYFAVLRIRKVRRGKKKKSR